MVNCSMQLQALARLGRGEYSGANGLNDSSGLLHQLSIAGVDALAQVQIVLESDAHIAAKQHSLGHPGHLHAADRKGAPIAVLRQRVDHGEQVSHVRRNAIGDAHAQLNHRRSDQQSFLDHLFDEGQITRIEYFQFRLDAQILANGGPLAQVIRRRYVGSIAVAEIQAAAIQSRNVRPVQAFMAQVDDMTHAVLLADKVAAGARGALEALIGNHNISTHAASQIDYHVDLALAYALDDLAV